MLATRLHQALALREQAIASEMAGGDPLTTVITRLLLAVEADTETHILTSVLKVEGNRLRHLAGPSLPEAYCAAIDGLELGPLVGSCGTAAFYGRPIYVTDIASDPQWADYRELAALYGLRACWSTPIFDEQRKVIATFAVYHVTPRGPTPEEIAALDAIADHVRRAISWSDSARQLAEETGIERPSEPA